MRIEQKIASVFIPFSPASIGHDEIDAVVDTLRSGWITTGPKVHQLEEAFTAYLGVESCLALNSCTAGLHLALKVCGIGPGDAVITTPMTFCSSVNVIEHVGARPVLVDIDPDTLNISPTEVERALNAHGDCVKAILPVHLYGHPVDMDALQDLAAPRGITIIEDAAHAVAARYKWRLVGTSGNLTAFSFYATKNLTTAEGGMLVGSKELIDSARVLGLHGMSRDAWNRYSAEGSWYYEVVAPGFKYNMTDIQAAIGLVQLRRLPEMQARRQEIVDAYTAAFSGVDALQVPIVRPDVVHAWHVYAIRLNLDRLSISRSQFIEELRDRNVGSSVHFIPIHVHPYYRDKYGFAPKDLPVAWSEYQRLISLPLSPALDDDQVARVIDAVSDIVSLHGR